MAFATIYIPPGVSERDYRRAARARGRGAASKHAVADLAGAAGFVDVREVDVTKAFARTMRAYLETSRTFQEELRAEWGDETVNEREHDRSATLALIDQGVLRRGIFTARRPT